MLLDPFLKKWLTYCQATTSKTSFYRFHIWKFVYKQAQDFYILLFWIFPFHRSLWQIGYKICIERESRGAGGQGDFVDRWLRFFLWMGFDLYLSFVQLVLGGLDFFANLLATTFRAKSKGTCQKRFSGIRPLRGFPPPRLNGKSVWEKEGFFP